MTCQRHGYVVGCLLVVCDVVFLVLMLLFDVSVAPVQLRRSTATAPAVSSSAVGSGMPLTSPYTLDESFDNFDTPTARSARLSSLESADAEMRRWEHQMARKYRVSGALGRSDEAGGGGGSGSGNSGGGGAGGGSSAGAAAPPGGWGGASGARGRTRVADRGGSTGGGGGGGGSGGGGGGGGGGVGAVSGVSGDAGGVPKLHAGFWSDAAPKPKPMAKRIVHHAAGGASSFHPRPRSGRTRRQRSGSVPPTQQGGRPVGGAEACGGGVDMDASPGVGVSSLHSTSPSSDPLGLASPLGSNTVFTTRVVGAGSSPVKRPMSSRRLGRQRSARAVLDSSPRPHVGGGAAGRPREGMLSSSPFGVSTTSPKASRRAHPQPQQGSPQQQHVHSSPSQQQQHLQDGGSNGSGLSGERWAVDHSTRGDNPLDGPGAWCPSLCVDVRAP